MDGWRRFVFGVFSDALASALLLRRAYFNNEMPARFQMPFCLVDKPIKYREAAWAAVKRDRRLEVAHAGG